MRPDSHKFASSALWQYIDGCTLADPGAQARDEINNSVVLTVTLGKVCFVFTGDAEAVGVWLTIAANIPTNTCFFKVPHHDSHNGTFDSLGQTPWLYNLPPNAKVVICSHLRPFRHPSATVVSALQPKGLTYRTDGRYHLRIKTDGQTVEVTYSHV